jgi:hypothetical protein
MTEEVKTPEAPQPQLPIVLTVAEIQGILTALRKFPMEQVEGLVMKIQNQANSLLQQMNKAETNETGETNE